MSKNLDIYNNKLIRENIFRKDVVVLIPINKIYKL